MKLSRKIYLCVFILFACSVADVAISSDAKLNHNEAYVLLDNLLNLDEINTEQRTQLDRYKEWEKLHLKFSSNNKLDKSQMKIYLFMTFISSEQTKTHSQEDIAKNIKPLFDRQSKQMLEILSELPFLSSSTCQTLSDHFALFGTKAGKQQFIKRYKKEISQSLSTEQAKVCLRKLKN